MEDGQTASTQTQTGHGDNAPAGILAGGNNSDSIKLGGGQPGKCGKCENVEKVPEKTQKRSRPGR